MRRIIVILLEVSLLTACSTEMITAQPEPKLTEEPRQIQPTADSSANILPTVDFDPPKEVSAATAMPPLEKDAWKQMPVVPTGVTTAMIEVYQRGLEMGNDPTHFSVIGDCQNVSSYFLSVYEKPSDYKLGPEYSYLQPTINYYNGSFSRKSAAVKGGFNAAAVISPLRADRKICNASESPLDCELRLWKPSVVFVSMETWWSQKPAEEYDKYMRRVLDRIIESGAVPILATKADNLEGDHAINATIAQLAYEYEIPLWNFWAAANALPDHGLSDDGFHLTYARNFFDDPKRMQNAWPWRNLTALQTLDVVRKGLTE